MLVATPSKPGSRNLQLLHAQHALTRLLADSPGLDQALRPVLAILGENGGFARAVAWRRDPRAEQLMCVAVWAPEGSHEAAAGAAEPIQVGQTAAGRAWASGLPEWGRARRAKAFDPRRDIGTCARLGVLAVPIVGPAQVHGVLELFCHDDDLPDPAVRLWLDVVAAQLAQHAVSSDLRRTLENRDRALTAAANGVVIADATVRGFPVVYVNPGFERMTGWSAAEILGRPCSILQSEETDPTAIAELRAALAAGREAHVTVHNRRRDGTGFVNEVFLSPVYEDGRLVEYVGVQNDVTERWNLERRAEHLAYYDSLTGLGNRALLRRELDHAATRVQRDGVRAALVFLDLDEFKQHNDLRGHAVGDAILCEVADRLRAVARPEDLLIRQGGDEFLVLIPGLAPRTATQQALAAAERIRMAVGEPFAVGGEPVALRASVGVSLLGGDATDPAQAMRHADTAMYRAKRISRGGVRLYRDTGITDGPEAAPVPSRQEDASEANARAVALGQVLSDGGLRSVYQPIVELESGAVVAFEALARGPLDSPVAQPDALFATARAEDRLGELDWACRAAAISGALAGGLTRGLRLFVNVEVDALAMPCPAELEEIWGPAADGLDVVIEITERALTARPADLLRLVAEVRARGWGVALDDVGADVRALAVMPLVRPDIIKLDLRLIQENPSTEIAEIIQAVGAESERTGALVLAEGIETDEHVAMARAMGATLGQGWHFGRPGELEPTPAPVSPIRICAVPDHGDDVSPYEVVARERPVHRGDKQLLFAISLQLEAQAAALGETALVASAFQSVERFTPLTAKRYARLAADAAFVAALGVGMSSEPVRGVRGADLRDDDVLRGEWSVAVLGPHFAAALVAVDLGEDGEDAERGFDFAVTYDRALVIAAASALIGRVQPLVKDSPDAS